LGIFDIKSRLNGFQKNNRFFSLILAKNDYIDLPIDPISVTSSSMPGRTVGESKIIDFGISYSIAGDLEYNDWSCTIRTWNYIDYRQIKYWFDMIHNESTIKRAKPSEYKTIGTLSQLNLDNMPIFNDIIKGVYPKSVGDITLSDDGDGLVTFDVTFNVDGINSI